MFLKAKELFLFKTEVNVAVVLSQLEYITTDPDKPTTQTPGMPNRAFTYCILSNTILPSYGLSWHTGYVGFIQKIGGHSAVL